jgi:ATP-dependent Clp protease adaptor protein ClpS
MSQRKRRVLAEILGGVLTAASQEPGIERGEESVTVAAPPQRQAVRRTRQKPKRPRQKRLPPWNVVLLDDDDHSYEYVIEMLGSVFGHNATRAFLMAREVDATGRVIVYTTHRELAELKREQIVGFGLDPRIASSRGGMGAVVEPAPGA